MKELQEPSDINILHTIVSAVLKVISFSKEFEFFPV